MATSRSSTPPARSAAGAESERWEAVGSLDRYEAGRLSTFKNQTHQIVIGKRSDGEVFALDNRCPHEGYPLAQGELNDCSLTCMWHNWKFDVRDGRCTLGGEDVRVYPVRVRDNTVEINFADPPLEEILPKLQQSLERALFHNDVPWALRDAARALRAGYEPWRLLADIARHDARRAEYGTTHVLAVATDCGRLLEHHPGVDALYPVAVALDLCAETNVRLPERVRRPASGGDLSSIRAAIQAEDAEHAEALLLGAFAAGASTADVESWFYDILSDRFLDFGHPLIYTVKAAELAAHVDQAYAPDLFAALLYSIVLGTREDRLPYMRSYFNAMPDERELAALWKRARPDAVFDAVSLRDAVLDGSARDAVQGVLSALESAVSAQRIAEALVRAAAHRFLRFDARWDSDHDVAENWLWVTHRLTFASAARQVVQRFESPLALRYLFQVVAFVHSGRRMDRPQVERIDPSRTEASEAGADVLVSRVLAAIQARRPDEAARNATTAMVSGAGPSLRRALEDLCVRDPAVRPIFVAHALKTTLAAFDEHEAATARNDDRIVPVVAAVRFLASPLAERRVAANVHNSLRWVVDGVMPRKLTQ